MEDHGRLMRVLEQQLAQDIDDDRQGDEGQCADRSQHINGLGRAVLADLVEETGEETHGEERVGGS